MSVKDREVPIWVCCDHDGPHEFTGIREIGFTDRGAFVINTWTTPEVGPGEPRGSYFTTIPISPVVYRRTRRTGVAFKCRRNRLTIYDDWGKQHHIEAPRAILDTLVAECVANEIPETQRGAKGRTR